MEFFSPSVWNWNECTLCILSSSLYAWNQFCLHNHNCITKLSPRDSPRTWEIGKLAYMKFWLHGFRNWPTFIKDQLVRVFSVLCIWVVEIVYILLLNVYRSVCYSSFSFVFWDKVSLCSPGWSWTYYVAQAGLKLAVIFLHQLCECWDYRHVAPCLI